MDWLKLFYDMLMLPGVSLPDVKTEEHSNLCQCEGVCSDCIADELNDSQGG